MRQLAPAAVGYGLLCALLAAQENGEGEPCAVETFGLDVRCHDCETFHMQMLEDGVNLTSRCGWPPAGSKHRPPSELTNHLFSIGKRPNCESCNSFYQRMLRKYPPFNLTDKCGWQPILDHSPPATVSYTISDEVLSGWMVVCLISVVLNVVIPVSVCSYSCAMRNSKCIQKRVFKNCLFCGSHPQAFS